MVIFFSSFKPSLSYRILSTIMRIQVWRAPEFHNDFWQKKLFLFIKNNFKRINIASLFIIKSYLKPFLSYLPCIVHREYFSIIFNVKKCALYSIKYGRWFFWLIFSPSINSLKKPSWTNAASDWHLNIELQETPDHISCWDHPTHRLVRWKACHQLQWIIRS